MKGSGSAVELEGGRGGPLMVIADREQADDAQLPPRVARIRAGGHRVGLVPHVVSIGQTNYG